jgi:hypothetical protein
VTEKLSGPALRRWAMLCAEEAANSKTDQERDRLVKMRKALLDLAETQDWLEGRSRDPGPPLQPG